MSFCFIRTARASALRVGEKISNAARQTASKLRTAEQNPSGLSRTIPAIPALMSRACAECNSGSNSRALNVPEDSREVEELRSCEAGRGTRPAPYDLVIKLVYISKHGRLWHRQASSVQEGRDCISLINKDSSKACAIFPGRFQYRTSTNQKHMTPPPPSYPLSSSQSHSEIIIIIKNLHTRTRKQSHRPITRYLYKRRSA